MQIYRFLKKSILLALFFGILATIILSPLGSNTTIQDILDVYNHIASIMQADVILSQGQFPIRIAPYELKGWGYPLFQFYSPSGYTIAALIYHFLTPANPYLAYKAMLWGALFLSGIYMYHCVRQLLPEKVCALLAGVVFVFSPYYLIVIHHMGAFCEALGIGIIPILLYYHLKVLTNTTTKNRLFAFLSIAFLWYLLLTIHLVTFAYTSLFFIIFFVGTAFAYKKYTHLILYLCAYLFSLLLASWYLMPIALYSQYLIVRDVPFHFSYHALSTLFSPILNVNLRLTSTYLRIQPALGLPIAFGFLCCIYFYFNRFKKIHRANQFKWLLPCLITFCISFLLVWNPFNLWRFSPEILQVGQYNWRLLAQANWLGTLLFAGTIVYLYKLKLDERHLFIGIALILISVSPWLYVPENNPRDLNQVLKNPTLVFNSGSYLIDPIKYINQISANNQILLSELMVNAQPNLLRTNTQLNIHLKPLSKGRVTPYIYLRGHIPEDKAYINKFLSVNVNDKQIGNIPLNQGPLNLNIGIERAVSQHNGNIKLEFKADPTLKIPIDSLILGGFMDYKKVMSIEEIFPKCKSFAGTITCPINVPADKTLIELPAFYYPQLLTVYLNDKVVSYYSILYRNYLITAIKTIPGQMNRIKISFDGLAWANYLSATSWGIFGLLVIYLIISTFRPEWGRK